MAVLLRAICWPKRETVSKYMMIVKGQVTVWPFLLDIKYCKIKGLFRKLLNVGERD